MTNLTAMNKKAIVIKLLVVSQCMWRINGKSEKIFLSGLVSGSNVLSCMTSMPYFQIYPKKTAICNTVLLSSDLQLWCPDN